MAGELAGAGLSLAAAACWGAADFNGGMGTKGGNPFGVVVVAHGVGLLCMLACAVAVGEAIPSHRAILFGLLAGVVGGLGLAALYRSLAVGKMGINAPVAAVITAALPVIYGVRSEGWPSSMQFGGFAIALVSIWLIAMPAGGIGRPEGLGSAVLAGIGFSGFLLFSKQAAVEAVFWPLVMARASSMLTMLLVCLAARKPWVPPARVMKFLLLAGVLDSAGNALFAVATRHGRLDVAAVLSSLYPATTVLLARFVLKERISTLQTTGMAAALIAVPLIAGR